MIDPIIAGVPPADGTFSCSIDIVIGADPILVRPIRLAVGGVASLAGFDVDAVDDLCVAVNELITTLIERGDGSSLNLRIASGPEFGVRVEGSTGAGPALQSGSDDAKRFRLSEQILSVMADSYGFDHAVDGGGAGITSGWFERVSDAWIDEAPSDGAGDGGSDGGP